MSSSSSDSDSSIIGSSSSVSLSDRGCGPGSLCVAISKYACSTRSSHCGSSVKSSSDSSFNKSFEDC